mgnify:CR=1 FL=1
MQKPVRQAKVQKRLDQEAAKLNASNRGFHKFGNICRATDGTRPNWTASFEMRGSQLTFDAMRQVIERVQAELPLVDFDTAEK